MFQPFLNATRDFITDFEPVFGEVLPLGGEETMASDACLLSSMGASIGA